MKRCMTLIIACGITLFNNLYTSEYTIRQYHDNHDHEKVFELITSQLSVFVDPEKAATNQIRLHDKLHQALKDGTPMNKVAFEEGSFRNTLFFDRVTIAGMVTYLITQKNSVCFIDTLCIKPKYTNTSMYELIIKTVSTYAREKKAKLVETFENKIRNKEEIDALTQLGFIEIPIEEKNSVTMRLIL